MIGFDAGPQRDTPRRVFQELTMGHAEFTLRNQPTQKPLSLDELWMPFTPNRDFKADPRIVVKAEGMYYWNDRGDEHFADLRLQPHLAAKGKLDQLVPHAGINAVSDAAL